MIFRSYKVIHRRAVMLLSYGNEIFTHQFSKIIFYTADAARKARSKSGMGRPTMIFFRSIVAQ